LNKEGLLEIIHKKAAALSAAEWEQIRLLNQKIIPDSLYDQNLYNGGCLQSTCDNSINKAMEMGTTDVLLGLESDQLISYMIFYCLENPPSLQARLDKYRHLGRVGYSDMLVVDPIFQKQGYARQMRTRMKEIGKGAKVDVFMTFVRSLPIPNIPSLLALRQAGAVSGCHFLLSERKIDGLDGPVQDICLEIIYPSDARILTTDSGGKVIWSSLASVIPETLDSTHHRAI
jgi:hypothetical protein